MPEKEEGAVLNRVQMMIFMLLGLAGVIGYGIYKYGENISAWSTWYLIATAIFGIWAIFDVIAFFASRNKK